MVEVRINKGIDAGTPANKVPREFWADLIKWRKAIIRDFIPSDCRGLLFYVEDGETTGDWLGFGSREAYLRQGLEIDPKMVDWAVSGLQLAGIEKPVPFADAVDRGKPSNILSAAPELAAHGQVGNGRSRVDIVNSKAKGGNSTEYLASRIKRDRPDIAEKIDDYPTVYAAAVAAGIIKPLSELTKLRKAWNKATQEDRQTFLDEVTKPHEAPV